MRYKVFTNPANGAIVLISENNPDILFYEEDYQLLKTDTRNNCIEFIKDYREENLIPEDEFIYAEIKNS